MNDGTIIVAVTAMNSATTINVENFLTLFIFQLLPFVLVSVLRGTQLLNTCPPRSQDTSSAGASACAALNRLDLGQNRY